MACGLLCVCCAAVNQWDNQKTSPLHWAVLCRHPAHVSILIKVCLCGGVGVGGWMGVSMWGGRCGWVDGVSVWGGRCGWVDGVSVWGVGVGGWMGVSVWGVGVGGWMGVSVWGVGVGGWMGVSVWGGRCGWVDGCVCSVCVCVCVCVWVCACGWVWVYGNVSGVENNDLFFSFSLVVQTQQLLMEKAGQLSTMQ